MTTSTPTLRDRRRGRDPEPAAADAVSNTERLVDIAELQGRTRPTPGSSI
jgi:hypothetical protein